MVLSSSVRTLIPLESLSKEVIDNLGINSENMIFLSSSILNKDNNVEIVVAKSSRINSTSKRTSTKYHLFRQHVRK